MEDVHKVGGIPAIVKYLLNHTDLIDGSQMTVTGKTLAQNLEDVEELSFDNQDVIRKLDNPIKKTGHLTILRGNLAPGSAVAKLTGKEGLKFEVKFQKETETSVLLTQTSRELQNALTGAVSLLMIQQDLIEAVWTVSSPHWKLEKSRRVRF